MASVVRIRRRDGRLRRRGRGARADGRRHLRGFVNPGLFATDGVLSVDVWNAAQLATLEDKARCASFRGPTAAPLQCPSDVMFRDVVPNGDEVPLPWVATSFKGGRGRSIPGSGSGSASRARTAIAATPMRPTSTGPPRRAVWSFATGRGRRRRARASAPGNSTGAAVCDPERMRPCVGTE